ncbi:MAG: type IV pilus secretin PilQ [Myxococcaceae bacterium]|nr:type IV pilus secretin PilQ [Myxococcaceae bacterium]
MNRLVTAASSLICLTAFAADRTELSSLTVAAATSGAVIRVEASAAPVFTVFRLQEPDRLVVDISNAQRGALAGHYDGLGPVSGVVVSQFNDGKSQVARLLVGLDKASKYDVRAEGTSLVVTVDGEAPPAAASSAPAAAVSQPPARSEASSEPTAQPSQEPTPKIDEISVQRPGTRVTALSYARGTLTLKTDGPVARIETLELSAPDRLAIDLVGLSGPARAPRVSDALVKELRVGSDGRRYRVVLEGADKLPAYDVKRVRGGVAVKLSTSPSPSGEQPEIVIDGARVDMEPQGEVATIENLAFKEDGPGGRVELTLSGRCGWKVERPDSRSAVLTLTGASLPRKLERSLDTQDLQTAVKMVSAFSVPGAQNKVRVVVAGSTDLLETVNTRPGVLSWTFREGHQAVESATSDGRNTAGVSVESSTFAVEGAPQRTRYVGKKVSFEFKDIDIHNLLRIIAEISKKNIVVADDVSGKVTIRLRNVPWDQALDLILRSKSLGQEDLGNIIRVAPLQKLQDEATSRQLRAEANRKAQPLSVQLVPVNYATAEDMALRVKEVLSERGKVTVDIRTNTLIVNDLPENMQKVRAMVASLDLQTPQVLIEARIVEANIRQQREIGIQWGGQSVLSQATGNPTGLQFPNNVAVTGGVVGGNNQGVSLLPNYAVSLPVGAQDGAGGAVGLVFGSAGNAATLNLRLSALESQGSVKTLSAPRITTLDNQQARISQGTSIPFSQVSAAGANTVFVDAILQLSVTPHITQDGSILMRVQASNNQPDPANAGANGQPAISRKEALTNVLVKDGDTTVIGGIYVRRGSSSTNGLPLLSKIPVIGFFFRNYRELESKDELLIFISPRILNRQTVAQNL